MKNIPKNMSFYDFQKSKSKSRVFYKKKKYTIKKKDCDLSSKILSMNFWNILNKNFENFKNQMVKEIVYEINKNFQDKIQKKKYVNLSKTKKKNFSKVLNKKLTSPFLKNKKKFTTKKKKLISKKKILEKFNFFYNSEKKISEQNSLEKKRNETSSNLNYKKKKITEKYLCQSNRDISKNNKYVSDSIQTEKNDYIFQDKKYNTLQKTNTKKNVDTKKIKEFQYKIDNKNNNEEFQKTEEKKKRDFFKIDKDLEINQKNKKEDIREKIREFQKMYTEKMEIDKNSLKSHESEIYDINGDPSDLSSEKYLDSQNCEFFQEEEVLIENDYFVNNYQDFLSKKKKFEKNCDKKKGFQFQDFELNNNYQFHINNEQGKVLSFKECEDEDESIKDIIFENKKKSLVKKRNLNNFYKRESLSANGGVLFSFHDK